MRFSVWPSTFRFAEHFLKFFSPSLRARSSYSFQWQRIAKTQQVSLLMWHSSKFKLMRGGREVQCFAVFSECLNGKVCGLFQDETSTSKFNSFARVFFLRCVVCVCLRRGEGRGRHFLNECFDGFVWGVGISWVRFSYGCGWGLLFYVSRWVIALRGGCHLMCGVGGVGKPLPQLHIRPTPSPPNTHTPTPHHTHT
jgi:hypothetical protein